MTRVLMVGTSARAAAESAARAGFDVTALDAFGDLNQHPSVHARSVQRDFDERAFTASTAARAAQAMACDAVAYLSPFENHPRTVGDAGAWTCAVGQRAEVLRDVRNPLRVVRALGDRRLAAAAVVAGDESDAVDDDAPGMVSNEGAWLAKPFASGGGLRVRSWDRFEKVPRGCYLQERIEGMPGSISFVAAGRRSVPLCVSRQLIGDSAFGADRYRYCGSILAPRGDESFGRDEELVDRACVLANAVAEEFGLVGVNGVDFVAHGGAPYAIEVNPRWSASMELAERAVRDLGVRGACAGVQRRHVARLRSCSRASAPACGREGHRLCAHRCHPWRHPSLDWGRHRSRRAAARRTHSSRTACVYGAGGWPQCVGMLRGAGPPGRSAVCGARPTDAPEVLARLRLRPRAWKSGSASLATASLCPASPVRRSSGRPENFSATHPTITGHATSIPAAFFGRQPRSCLDSRNCSTRVSRTLAIRGGFAVRSIAESLTAAPTREYKSVASTKGDSHEALRMCARSRGPRRRRWRVSWSRGQRFRSEAVKGETGRPRPQPAERTDPDLATSTT